MSRAAAAVAVALLLAGCASRSTLTLLPGENGAATGAVAVLDPKTGQDRGVVTQANSRTPANARRPRPRAVSATAIDARYGQLIADLPPPPESFTLYFVEGSTALTAQSEEILKQLFAAVAAREGAEVQIVGHTDTLGSSEDNDRLSLARAREIRDALIVRGLPAESSRATGRGERDLLERTDDGVRNARNRRVELIVR
ncbi:OmpA family protein [Sphingomonas sp. 1P06PA]|uniref:OmpA family protein n=1 Tax=Sphingomonas sp. 1P06PA TaxID=554121 RepID=UPI0039A6E297